MKKLMFLFLFFLLVFSQISYAAAPVNIVSAYPSPYAKYYTGDFHSLNTGSLNLTSSGGSGGYVTFANLFDEATFIAQCAAGLIPEGSFAVSTEYKLLFCSGAGGTPSTELFDQIWTSTSGDIHFKGSSPTASFNSISLWDAPFYSPGQYSFAGFSSRASGQNAAAFGEGSQAGGKGSFAAGGFKSNALANFSFVGGGIYNYIDDQSPYSAVVGGSENQIKMGANSAIVGGYANMLEGYDVDYSTILGGLNNYSTGGANISIINGNGVQMQAGSQIVDINGTNSSYNNIGNVVGLSVNPGNNYISSGDTDLNNSILIGPKNTRLAFNVFGNNAPYAMAGPKPMATVAARVNANGTVSGGGQNMVVTNTSTGNYSIGIGNAAGTSFCLNKPVATVTLGDNTTKFLSAHVAYGNVTIGAKTVQGVFVKIYDLLAAFPTLTSINWEFSVQIVGEMIKCP